MKLAALGSIPVHTRPEETKSSLKRITHLDNANRLALPSFLTFSEFRASLVLGGGAANLRTPTKHRITPLPEGLQVDRTVAVPMHVTVNIRSSQFNTCVIKQIEVCAQNDRKKNKTLLALDSTPQWKKLNSKKFAGIQGNMTTPRQRDAIQK